MTDEQVNKKLIAANWKRAKINAEIKALNEMLQETTGSYLDLSRLMFLMLII